MENETFSVIYLLLVLAMVIPGFWYANKNKKTFVKNIIMWSGIVGLIAILVIILKE